MTEVLESTSPEARYREYRAEEARFKAKDELTFERNNRMRFYFLVSGAVSAPLVFFYLQGLSWENVPLAIAAAFIGFMVGSIISFFFERDEANTIVLVNSRNEAARELLEKATQANFLKSDYIYLTPERWNEVTMDFGSHVQTVVACIDDEARVAWKPKTS